MNLCKNTSISKKFNKLRDFYPRCEPESPWKSDILHDFTSLTYELHVTGLQHLSICKVVAEYAVLAQLGSLGGKR